MGSMPPSARVAELRTRYQEIDQLLGLQWRSPEVRRWQAAVADALRGALGFHPAVVEFAGLRFRAGPVSASSGEDLGRIPDAEHTARMRQDLTEAKKLLRRALATLHVDVDTVAATMAPDRLAAAVALLPAAERDVAAHAAERLGAALASPDGAWGPVASALRDLLGSGPGVGRAAVGAVAERLPALR